MAGASDIAAGNAFVTLALKGGAAFRKGLQAAGDQLKSFGAGVTTIGAGVAGVGTAIVGPLLAAVDHFSDVGSALADMSARTGKAGSELAALGYAADMTGASLADVEKAITIMAKKGDTRTFDQVAADIAKIEDPAERTRAAIEAWGKSGVKLLPMVENLQALKAAAIEKGLVPSDEAIAAADEVGDAVDDVKKGISALVFEVGSALAGTVTTAAKTISRIVTTCIKWAKANQGLIRTVAMVGAGLVAAGGAIMAIGTAIAGAGFVLSGIAAALGAVASVVGAILSPLGLLTAAVVAGVYAWARYTESGKAAVSGIMGFLGTLKNTVMGAVGGIADALKAGDLELAGRIAMAGLKVAFLQGVAAISGAIGGAFGDFLGTIGTQIANGDMAGAWDTTIKSMAGLWASFSESIVNMFTAAMRGVASAWQKTTSAISSWILANAGEGGLLGSLGLAGTGVDMQEEQGRENANNAGQIDTWNKRKAQLEADLAKAQGEGGSFTDNVGNVRTVETINAELAEAAKRLAELGKGPVDVTAAAQGTADDILADQAGGFTNWLDDLDKAMADRSEKAWAPTGTKGGAAGAGTAADDAMRELDALRDRAAGAAAAVDQEKKDGAGAIEEAAGGQPGKAKGEMAASFSASALAAMGQGGGPMERAARAAEDMVKEQRQANRKLDRVASAIEDGGAFE